MSVAYDGEGGADTTEFDELRPPGFTARLDPENSRSSSSGRHKIVVENTGGVPIFVEFHVDAPDESLTAELAAPAINIDPEKTANVELRLTPHEKFWQGEGQAFQFAVDVNGSDGEPVQLVGSYEQVARVRPWWLPAIVGALIALLLGTLAWFLLLRPAVENIAEDKAREVNEADQAALDQKIAELDQAAAEANELPLGDPTDFRLAVSADPGTAQTSSFEFDPNGSGRILSITDVLLQNPGGAVGPVQLLRESGGTSEILFESEMANFRDLGVHLVAPYQIRSGETISFRVECQAGAPSTGDCSVAASLVGFVDDA
jgi:hypothetical protein